MVADYINADPDSSGHLHADPDLTFCFNMDPDQDHASHQSDANRGLQILNGSIQSIHVSFVSVPQWLNF
jgi:hypothetical protein